MYSREYKLTKLKEFYFNTTLKHMPYKCPFGKEVDKEPIKFPCVNLCGTWPELGNIKQGCPCHILGPMGAMIQLERLLIKEGYLDSMGRDI